jgi:hypothetical protein
MSTIFSGTIKGIGSAKGGAFATHIRNNFTSEEISTAAITAIDQLALDGYIDSTSNLADNFAIIISGANDPTVPAKE